MWEIPHKNLADIVDKLFLQRSTYGQNDTPTATTLLSIDMTPPPPIQCSLYVAKSLWNQDLGGKGPIGQLNKGS